MGEQGSCMIPDLSAYTLVHHCLSPELLACGLFFAVGMACRDLAFSPVSDLPSPHFPPGYDLYGYML